MISNLQFLRAFAALGVVLYHAQYQIRENVGTEFFGVAIFFVISGFIMTYTTRDKRDGFLLNRLIRIVPLYALVTLSVFLFTAWDEEGLAMFRYIANGEGAAYGYTLGNVVQSVLFMPYLNHAGNWHPLIGVGWTLNLEMYFYVLFAAMLCISARLAPLLASLAILAVNQLAPLYPDTVLAFYGHTYTYYFIYGMLAFYVWRAAESYIEKGALKTLSAPVAVVVAACLMLASLYPELGMSSAWIPPAVVGVALWLHSAGWQIRWKPALLLGEASYALYLIHIIVVEKVNGVTANKIHILSTKDTLLGLAVAVGLSILFAILLHLKVEKPLTKWLRSKPAPRLPASVAAQQWKKPSTPSATSTRSAIRPSRPTGR